MEYINCPKCGSDNIYLGDGYNKCEDCGNEFLLESEAGDDDIYLQTYNHLIKFKEPFFKLKHGQLYSCSTESKNNKSQKQLFFIPLAWEKNRNRFFILCCFDEKPKESPEFLLELLNKSFDIIKKEGRTGEYPESYKGLPLLCTTDKDGAILLQVSERWLDFKEI